MQSGNPNNQSGDDPYWQPDPYQYQNQQYPGNQQPLYQGYQQSPYQQPPIPGQFQYPPSYNAPQQSRSGCRQWYRTQTRKTKFGLGCGAIIVVLLFFSCIIAASASGTVPSSQTPTATTTTVQVAVLASPTVAQDTPTPGVTQQPTPTPTPIPTATPIPTQASQPTQPTRPPPPTPTPMPRPTPTPASCQAVNGNPWCYNFNPGKFIYIPPSGFCSYFNCIPSFVEPDDPGDGYVVQCTDGMFSQSGSERGACSFHGGVMRPLYSH